VYRWEELVVPDNLDEMINAFANLTPENRFRFFKGLSVGVRWLCALGHPCFFFLYRISCRHRVATSRGPCFGKVSEVRSRHGTRPYATVPWFRRGAHQKRNCIKQKTFVCFAQQACTRQRSVAARWASLGIFIQHFGAAGTRKLDRTV